MMEISVFGNAQHRQYHCVATEAVVKWGPAVAAFQHNRDGGMGDRGWIINALRFMTIAAVTMRGQRREMKQQNHKAAAAIAMLLHSGQ